MKHRPVCRLAGALKLPVKGTLLDAGGGTGRIAKLLRPLVSRVVVMDPSLAMLRQTGNLKALYPLCAATETLPFKPDTFERIVVVDALHHFQNQTVALLELWRVLKPGGRLLIEEPDIQHGLIKVVALMERAAGMRSHFHSRHWIADVFARHQIAAQSQKASTWSFYLMVDKPATQDDFLKNFYPLSSAFGP